MPKEKKSLRLCITLIVEGLADPVRIIFDAEYCAESVAMYIEAANIARSILHMPPIDLDSYPD